MAETIYGLTKDWADWLYNWRSAVTVVGGLLLAGVGGLGYWGQLAREEFTRRANDPNRFTATEHVQDGNLIIEIRPHGGRWYPFLLLVPFAERDKLIGLRVGPSGAPPNASIK